MSNKQKVSVKLEPGEALVVLKTEQWAHISWVYRDQATFEPYAEAKEAWLNIAEQIDGWVADTEIPFTTEYDE